MSLILFIIILAVLILAHEFGHFIVAKMSGIRVDEFGLGFPPKLYGKKFGETEYTLNAIPFGGFVKIYGENPEEESPLEKVKDIFGKSRSFSHKPRYIQAAVLLAGVTFNLLLAWILLSGGLMAGMPTSADEAALRGVALSNPVLTATSVLEKSPAEKAGMKAGDKIILAAAENSSVKNPSAEAFQKIIAAHPDQSVKILVERGKQNKEINVVPMKGLSPEYKDLPAIGVSLDTVGTMRLPWYQAIMTGGALTIGYTEMTFVGLYDLLHDALFGKADLSSVSGPVGIVKIVGDASVLGFSYLIMLTALISINLAVVNVLPIPALDGGRLFFLLIEAVIRKPLRPKVVNFLNAAGFAILMILIVLVTFHDIWKLFH